MQKRQNLAGKSELKGFGHKYKTEFFFPFEEKRPYFNDDVWNFSFNYERPLERHYRSGCWSSWNHFGQVHPPVSLDRHLNQLTTTDRKSRKLEEEEHTVNLLQSINKNRI